MTPKPILCACGKRFNTDDAMLQHQRDSQRHVATPQAPVQILRLNELVQRLSLQDQEANNGFTPFLGSGPTTFLALGSDIHKGQVMAGVEKSFVAEGTKPKKKKTRKGTSLHIGIGHASHSSFSHSSFKVNQNTGQMMNLLEGQDWALCDKDCGWCGHCADGPSY